MSDLRRGFDMLRTEGALWAMEPTRLASLAAVLARSPDGINPDHRADMRSSARTQLPAHAAATAVIPIIGPLVRRGGILADMFGLASYSGIRNALAQAASDRSVSRVVLLVDSPGGTALGCEEVADDVARVARIKPVTAFVDGLCASAAYWIASQAQSLVSTASGEIGSIGVFVLHADESRLMDEIGVTPTFIVSKASPRKVDGNSLQPLKAEAKARFQADVDAIAGKFVGAVARGRRISAATVKADFGQGATLFAGPAKSAGMVDGIGRLEEVLRVAPQGGAARADHAGLGAVMAAALSRRRDKHTSQRRRRLDLLGAS